MRKILFCFALFCCLGVRADDVRVFVDVVGDLFHAGHVTFFEKAKAEGDYLIVGIHGDDAITDYKRRPVLTMDERWKVIEACRHVDEVILDAPLGVTREFIEEHRIDLVIHGDDFNADTLDEQYGVPIEMGIFKTVPYTEGISTSDIIDRIREREW